MEKLNIPQQITVKVTRIEGGYFAELVEYDAFTEFTDIHEGIAAINDLIFCYFDVPVSLQKKITYQKVATDKQFLETVNKPLLLSMFSTPDIAKIFS